MAGFHSNTQTHTCTHLRRILAYVTDHDLHSLIIECMMHGVMGTVWRQTYGHLPYALPPYFDFVHGVAALYRSYMYQCDVSL